LIQFYATAAFEFDQSDNGWLMAEFAFVRGFFLMLMFPSIITWGRRWMSSKAQATASFDQEGGRNAGSAGGDDNSNSTSGPVAGDSTLTSRGTTIVENEIEDVDETSKLLPTDPGQFDMPAPGEQVDQEPTVLEPAKHTDKEEESPVFDLVFLRWSLVIDGLMTTIAAFATKRWHIYLGRF
jgi:hypothetical protein